MKHRTPYWLLMTAMLFLLLSGYWLIRQSNSAKLSELSLATQAEIQSVEAKGKVLTPVAIEIVSQVNGKVVSAQLLDGQDVHAGQIMLIIESSEGRRAIELARNSSRVAAARFKKISTSTLAGSEQSLRLAKSAVEKAKLQYTRTSELSQRGLVGSYQSSEALGNLAIAQNQLANVQFQVKANRAQGSDYALAETELNQARASENAIRKKFENSFIAAKSDGVLLTRNVQTGSMVKAGQILLSYIPTGKKQLSVQVEKKSLRLLAKDWH